MTILNVMVPFIVLIHLVGVARILILLSFKVFVVMSLVKNYLKNIKFHLVMLFIMRQLINVLLNIYLFDKFIRGKRQHSSGGYIEIILFAFIAALIVSLIIVIKAADLFVDNLVEIGLALGISEIILGVTASAVGLAYLVLLLLHVVLLFVLLLRWLRLLALRPMIQ